MTTIEETYDCCNGATVERERTILTVLLTCIIV